MEINKKLIEDGYISVRKHPECEYYIYNYTHKTQYEGMWNTTTKACRGLILDDRGNIIARPFNKFFNYEEYGKDMDLGELPAYESFECFEKMDGSLGILYITPNDSAAIATRGSFTSEQAIRATEILNKKHKATIHALKLQSYVFTFLFEIIYPENRIVVDYGNTEGIALLAVINKETGEEWTYNEVKTFGQRWNTEVVTKYSFKDFNKVLQNMSVDTHNREGFVIKTNTGFRFKLKFEEYKRLHKVLTGVNEKYIWEALKEGQTLDNLVDNVPDEFNQWVKETKAKLEMNYNSIEHNCKVIVDHAPSTDRKEIAQLFLAEPHKVYSGVLFAMYDKKDYSKIIWAILKPEKQIPYKVKN